MLPKLREENERLFAKKKGKPVKDVISEGKLLSNMIHVYSSDIVGLGSL